MRRLTLGLAILSLGSTETVRACAPAPAEGERVEIATEEALIVWDAASRTEHFVRRADFSTGARDFGFLVPTPTPPTLTEAPEGIFDALAARLEPEVVYENDYTVIPCLVASCLFMFTAGSADDDAIATAPAVRVLSSQRVAGMDATVLAANDADALAAWLSERGYAMRPALVEWLRPYVRAGFAITAFRYAGGAEGAPVGSRAVRMSFTTDEPFYPYREPTDQTAEPGRVLRVHLVTTGRGEGRLGEAAWGAEVSYARPLTEGARLLEGVAAPPAGAWLTTFVDRATRRAPEHDLHFARASATEEVVPSRVSTREVFIPLPLELFVLIAGVVALVRRRKRV